MTTQITVLGLGQIGTSIGLALATHKGQVVRVGNDKDNAIARQAEKLGAFDKIHINLHSACENTDILVLALPVDEVIETLKEVVDDLRPGVVVIDTSPVKVQLMDSAAQVLGEDRYYVTMSSSLNPAYFSELETGPQAAHADLFQDSVMVITSPPGTHAGAIDLVADLTGLLGGKPFFADPMEADGLIAASYTLPKLVSAALLHAVTGQPGWREGRKLAGKTFAQGTAAALDMDEAKSLGQSAMLNRDNVVRVIDNLTGALENVRDMLERGDEEALSDYITRAQEARELWLSQRLKADWESETTPKAPSMGEVLGHLVGIRPKKDKGKK